MEITIRPLRRKDRKFLGEVIKKLVDKVGDKSLLEVIRGDMTTAPQNSGAINIRDDRLISLGVKVIKLALDTLEEEIVTWFADLTGKSVQEFDELPFNVEMVILEKLLEQPELSDFFTRASRSFRKIKSFAKPQ